MAHFARVLDFGMLRRVALAAVVLGLGFPGLAGVATAKEDPSQLTKVSVVPAPDDIAVIVRGSQPPNFTSFTLSDPFRVVLDWAGSQLAGVRLDQKFDEGLIRRIRLRQFSSESEQISRVIVELSEPTTYRVESDGNAVVMHFTPVAESEPEPVEPDPEPEPAEPEPEPEPADDLEPLDDLDSVEDDDLADDEVDELDELSDDDLADEDLADEDLDSTPPITEPATEVPPPPPPAAPPPPPPPPPSRAAPPPLPSRAAPPPPLPSGGSGSIDDPDMSLDDEDDLFIVDDEDDDLLEEEPASAAPVRRAAPPPPPRAPPPTPAAREAEPELAPLDDLPETDGASEQMDQPRLRDPGRRTMTYIGFRQMAGTSRVFVKLDGRAAYRQRMTRGSTFVVELLDTTVNVRNNERPLDTTYFDSPVSRIQARRRRGLTRIEIELRESVPWRIKRIGTTIAIDFVRPS